MGLVIINKKLQRVSDIDVTLITGRNPFIEANAHSSHGFEPIRPDRTALPRKREVAA